MRICGHRMHTGAARMQEKGAAAEKFLGRTIEQVQQAANAQLALEAQKQQVVLAPADGAVPESTELSAAQKMAIQVAIQNAATLEEVHRLESALKAGRVPDAAADATDVAAMEEG
jgi:hypothetical protein